MLWGCTCVSIPVVNAFTTLTQQQHKQQQQPQDRRRQSIQGRLPPSVPSSQWIRTTPSTTTSTTSTQLFVFERMSENAIAAIATAQEQARNLYLTEVGNEVLMAGCVMHPDPSLARTLKQYSITWRRVQPTLVDMYSSRSNGNDDDDAQGKKNQGWLSNFRAAKDNDNDLPFSRDLKLTLQQAGRLADRMSCTVVEPHHLFLALLEYQEEPNGDGGGADATAATIDEENNICTCGGWAVLVKTDVLADDLTALTLCKTLLSNILNDSQMNNSNQKELVTGINSSGKTPTLAEVGTDLTEQAANGLLDPVYGRNEEIRSCIRTLIRRRKNNVRCFAWALFFQFVCLCVFVCARVPACRCDAFRFASVSACSVVNVWTKIF